MEIGCSNSRPLTHHVAWREMGLLFMDQLAFAGFATWGFMDSNATCLATHTR